MNNTLLLLLNGLTYGGLLFIIASGFTLIFGLMRVVNMAHGTFYILGAYVAYSIQQQTGEWVLGVIGATIAVGLTAIIVQWLVTRVEGDMPRTLLTIGASLIMADLSLWIWGGLPLRLRAPDVLREPMTIGDFTYPTYRLFVLVVAVIIAIGLWIMMYRTRVGMIIRAGVDNRAMVSALGINIDRMFVLIYVLGGLLTGFSGALGGSYIAFGPGTDFTFLLYALIVVMVGGMGSLAGSAVGALIVGLVDSFGRTYFSELAIFLLSGTLIVILAFRPQGLFGKSA